MTYQLSSTPTFEKFGGKLAAAICRRSIFAPSLLGFVKTVVFTGIKNDKKKSKNQIIYRHVCVCEIENDVGKRKINGKSN